MGTKEAPDSEGGGSVTYTLDCKSLAFILKANREFTRKRERPPGGRKGGEGKSQKGGHQWPVVRL